jgi:hypothetical protein
VGGLEFEVAGKMLVKKIDLHRRDGYFNVSLGQFVPDDQTIEMKITGDFPQEYDRPKIKSILLDQDNSKSIEFVFDGSTGSIDLADPFATVLIEKLALDGGILTDHDSKGGEGNWKSLVEDIKYLGNGANKKTLQILAGGATIDIKGDKTLGYQNNFDIIKGAPDVNLTKKGVGKLTLELNDGASQSQRFEGGLVIEQGEVEVRNKSFDFKRLDLREGSVLSFVTQGRGALELKELHVRGNATYYGDLSFANDGNATFYLDYDIQNGAKFLEVKSEGGEGGGGESG